MIKGVFVDLDGTLIDSIKVYREISIQLFKEKFSVELKKEDLEDMGSDPVTMLKRLLDKYKLNNVDIEELAKERDKRFLDNIDKVKLTTGALDLLNFLKEKKMKIGIVTSSSKDIVYKILDNIGIRNLFDVIITKDDVVNTKPDPEGYIKAYKALNLLPHECIAIEDSVYGVLAAKRAGLRVFAVTTGSNSRKDLKSLNVEKIFKNLKELKKYLEQEFLPKEENKY